jgi:hypothetical protein
VDVRTTMSSESVCQVARSWVDVGSFHTRLVACFMTFTASVRNILDTPSYFLHGHPYPLSEYKRKAATSTCLEESTLEEFANIFMLIGQKYF